MEFLAQMVVFYVLDLLGSLRGNGGGLGYFLFWLEGRGRRSPVRGRLRL